MMESKEYWVYCFEDEVGFEGTDKDYLQDQLRKHRGHSFTVIYDPSLIQRILWKVKRMLK